MRSIRFLVIGALLGVATAGAQQAAPPAADPIGGNLFPPELVMSHQGDIHLTDAQRDSIVAAVSKAQQRATELQWKMQREVEKMISLVRQAPVNEVQTLAQLDSVLALEREIKRLQLTVMIRIKNQLTPEQRAMLQAIREGAIPSTAH